MQNYILFTAFNDAAINECRFSLLKLLSLYNLKLPDSIGIVVYTDAPQAFDVFTTFLPALYFLTVPNKAMDDKSKADVISHFFENYKGNILYCSTTTYATQPLEDLFNIIENGTIIVNKRYAAPDKMQQQKNTEQFSIVGI